jgi:hypothetical protein
MLFYRAKWTFTVCSAVTFLLNIASARADDHEHSASEVKGSPHTASPANDTGVPHAAESVKPESEPIAEGVADLAAAAVDLATEVAIARSSGVELPGLFRSGVQLQGHSDGGAFLLDLLMEGERWGFKGSVGGLAFKDANGKFRDDGVGLIGAYATYKFLVSEPRGRLRAEAGLSMATGNGVSIVAPAMGLSGEVKIVGPLQLEGALHVAPFPAAQVDWNLGLAARFGWFLVNTGWHQRLIDSTPLLSEFTDSHVFSGPYLGVAMVF